MVRPMELVVLSFCMMLASCAGDGPARSSAESDDPPGLRVGDQTPPVSLATIEGDAVSLESLYADHPIIVNFYRGGWCPYCEDALQGWQARIEDVRAAGAELYCVVMEKPSYAEATIDEHDLAYAILIDEDGSAARAFKVAFALPDTTRSKYEGYGIDLSEHNVSGRWELPAPGTFVIDSNGTVRYAFADWNYKRRADPDEVIEAVRSIAP